MKFELEQRDENFIDIVSKHLEDENESVNVKRALLLKHPDRKYNLVFSIKDLAKAFDDSVDSTNKDILITNGFTEALNIIISSLTKPGDYILCENPTHNVSLKIFKSSSVP